MKKEAKIEDEKYFDREVKEYILLSNPDAIFSKREHKEIIKISSW